MTVVGWDRCKMNESVLITATDIFRQGELLDTVDSLTYESYIEVEGTVRRRPEGQENMVRTEECPSTVEKNKMFTLLVENILLISF